MLLITSCPTYFQLPVPLYPPLLQLSVCVGKDEQNFWYSRTAPSYFNYRKYVVVVVAPGAKRRVEDFTGEAPAGEGERADPVERWGQKMAESSNGQ